MIARVLAYNFCTFRRSRHDRQRSEASPLIEIPNAGHDHYDQVHSRARQYSNDSPSSEIATVSYELTTPKSLRYDQSYQASVFLSKNPLIQSLFRRKVSRR